MPGGVPLRNHQTSPSTTRRAYLVYSANARAGNGTGMALFGSRLDSGFAVMLISSTPTLANPTPPVNCKVDLGNASQDSLGPDRTLNLRAVKESECLSTPQLLSTSRAQNPLIISTSTSISVSRLCHFYIHTCIIYNMYMYRYIHKYMHIYLHYTYCIEIRASVGGGASPTSRSFARPGRSTWSSGARRVELKVPSHQESG